MFFLKILTFVGKMTLFATALTPLGAAYADPSSGRISVSGYVAVICRAELSGGILSSTDRVSLGRLTELCNTSQGYQVIMTYPSGLEGAKLLIDGVPMTLNGTGQAIVADSYMAAYRVRELELDLGPVSTAERQNGLNVSFRAVPRGGV